ncbi:11158_t:CDS:1, partial [Scutellospora calospora]
IILGPNKPSKYQINNYLVLIIDELVDFASGIDLLATFEYKKGCKIYVALILSLNNILVARKICDYTNYTVKYYRCLKCAAYDNLSKRSYYGSFENMDEWFNPVDITKYFDTVKEWLNCTNKQERDNHISKTG